MLEAINLSKSFGEHQALKDLNLRVQPGEIFCLLGANGAGKSTTINLFLNFLKPTSGQALIKGIDVTKDPKSTKGSLTYIPENLTLYPHLSGLENLDYFVGLTGKKLQKEELRQYLMEAGLQENAHDQRVSGFSKGMRQKVGIALAIARQADVLLLDEPTSGLDPYASNEFSELLMKMKERGVATLMATHDLFRAHAVGTHVGIMNLGELKHTWSAQEITLHELEESYLDIINPRQHVEHSY